MSDRPAVEAVLIDLDGTMWVGDEPVPGAAEAVRMLRAGGVGVRFVTNTTRRRRRDVMDDLERMGVEVGEDDCLTASSAAAVWLRERVARRVRLLLPELTFEEFAGFELDADDPEYVLVGDLGAGWTYEVLNRALRWLLAGARLVAIQRNRFWSTGEGACLDAGAFVAALEYASGQTAELVGKPSAAFFETAARGLGATDLGRVAMVGDDLEADVLGARRAGLLGVAVRTGKMRYETLDERGPAPTAVLDSVSSLPEWVERYRASEGSTRSSA